MLKQIACGALCLLLISLVVIDFHITEDDTGYARAPSPLAVTSLQQQVLLVAYARSGSTYTTDLIDFSDDAFTTLEPLVGLSRDGKLGYEGMNTLRDYDRVAEEAMDIVESYLSCKFYNVTLNYLGLDIMSKNYGNEIFYTCLAEKGMKPRSKAEEECYRKLLDHCYSHRVSVVKTIRFRVEWARQMMLENPGLKLVYLVRDPRATLSSQASTLGRFALPRDAEDVSSRHCERVEKDLLALSQLKVTFPGRVKAVRYEDGAMDPMDFARDIYSFLDLPVTKELQDYTEYLTTPTKTNAKFAIKTSFLWEFSTRRSEPRLAMDHWRDTMDMETVTWVDWACGHLYETLGYVRVDTLEQLRDVNGSSLTVVPSPGGIFGGDFAGSGK